MNIDFSKTLIAYNGYEGMMEHLTRVVHDYVLSDEYLGNTSKCKQLLKGITKIEDANDELLLQSFVGKLRYKLPALHLTGSITIFERERARLIASSLVTNVLLDSGLYELREEVESITVNGQKKFKKFFLADLEDKLIHAFATVTGFALTGAATAATLRAFNPVALREFFVAWVNGVTNTAFAMVKYRL